MYDDSSRSEAAVAERTDAAALQRGHGVAELGFARRGGRSALTHLYQRTPCRVLFPLPDAGEPPLAVLLTTSGGLTGGDEISIQVAVGAGAAATVTSQAAEKLYRSLGPDAAVRVALEVGAGGYLEYLPQETILFDGARLMRRTRCAVAAGGRFVGAEMLVFGRAARGERMVRGRVFDAWRVRRAGRLVWADALALESDIAGTLSDPYAGGGAAALATAIYVGPDAAALLQPARDWTAGAASLVNGVLVARLAGPVAHEVRGQLAHYLACLRQAAGWAPRLPRIWHA